MTTVTDQPQDTNAYLVDITGLRAALLAKQKYLFVKRIFDLAICLSMLPFILLLVVIIAIAIRIDSQGPPIFTQERVGKDGRRFRMYKFRTMRHDYDEPAHRIFMQAFIAGEIDFDGHSKIDQTYKPPIQGHITRLGRALRKTSLDELPQVFNILKGEMSLIGPRPNVVWEVEKYRDWHHERLRVLPGITGLAQVQGRSMITFDRMVQYDLEYIQKQSLSLDIKIFWWTARSVLGREGAG